MSEQKENKVAIKLAELIEAIKEEIQADKQGALQYVQDLKAATIEKVEETKEVLHEVAETTQKNIHEKTEQLINRKDEVVINAAEILKKAIDHAKVALVKEVVNQEPAQAGTDADTTPKA